MEIRGGIEIELTRGGKISLSSSEIKSMDITESPGPSPTQWISYEGAPREILIEMERKT